MVRYSLLLVFVLCAKIVLAQSFPHPFFNDGARVCFTGNSITNNGEFHHNLLLYNITRFPGQTVTFFNCGISGDVTEGVLNRMEDDILIHQPTHAAIMLGMNDVNRSLYGSGETQNSDTLKRRAEAIHRYKQNLEKIITILLSKEVRVILQRPTIYDQTVALATKNNLGVNDALRECAVFIGELAEKYNLPVVDYWSVMERLNRELQQKNPSATITGPDRVHPASTGHLVMAYQFLKMVQAPQYVSKIMIRRGIRPNSTECLNCEIKSFSAGKNCLSFTVKEYSLPFPTTDNQYEALDLVPFINDFNVQLLKIGNLKKGQYELRIDGKVTGIFSDRM